MQKCRPLSFLCTEMTVTPWTLTGADIAHFQHLLHVHTDLVDHGWGNPLELPFKDFIINSSISCFARSVQPNSPGSKEKMSWYLANRMQAATWFPLDHPSRPDKSSCWKSTSLLLSTDILVCWIPCTLSSSSKVPGTTSTWGTGFTATTWVTLMPLAIVTRMAVRFFATTTTRLLLEVTSVCVHHTQAERQVGVHQPLSGTESLHVHCFPGA